MVAKKKPSAQSANAAEKKASAKKKSAPNTFTYKGQTVTGIKSAPTAAVTAKGQKATGLARRPASQRGTSLRSEPKVKVKNAESGFAGSGLPLNQSLAGAQPLAARNLIPALMTATLIPGKGKIAAAIGRRVGMIADDAAFGAASKGLSASGAGGRVAKTFTPMGPTLRSTSIGTEAQQAARMGNLVANADRIGTATGRKVAGSVYGTLRRAGTIARVGNASILVPTAVKRSRQNKK